MQVDTLLKASATYAQEFANFLDSAYSVYHVSDVAKNMLESKGYIKLKENENWNLKQGGKYYFSRNNTAVLAFTVGSNFDEQNTGFKIVAAHLDSPVLQFAPVSKLKSSGFNQACIQTYGGGSWHTWLDRDLNLAGRVIYLDETTKQYTTKLWKSSFPFMKISNLAIHLQTADQRKALSVNKETQLRPIISTEVFDSLLEKIKKGDKPQEKTEEKKDKKEKQDTTEDKHYQALITLICDELNIKKESIIDMELQLSDSQKANIVGLNKEFISAHKIDNLVCTFAALKAFETNATESKKFVDMIVLFDHEEIGSNSAHGAKSTLINDTINRIFRVLSTNFNQELIEKAKANSLIASTDVTHSIHPNYKDKHQINHLTQINKGLNISYDPNQYFASSAVTRSVIYEICKKAQIPYCDFITPNDLAGGATLGPSLSSITGIRTGEIGPALTGMHSIRETGGTLDAYYQYVFCKGFFDEFEKMNLYQLFSQ